MRKILAALALCCVPAFCAEPSAISKYLDSDLSNLEREIVPLAQEMPAEKYNFAPTGGEFKGVRTFGLQVRHVATVMYSVSAALLGEKPPVDMGMAENGADTLKTKEQIVQYLKDSFVYAHKAMASVTDTNLGEMIKSPFGAGTMPRIKAATINTWHGFDHYGQMVVYLRMNGLVPPASR